MNRKELVNTVAEKTELTKKDVTLTVDKVFETIQQALVDGEDVKLQGFGKWEKRERSARKGRNPQTGEEIEIAASKNVGFTPLKGLKEAVKNS